MVHSANIIIPRKEIHLHTATFIDPQLHSRHDLYSISLLGMKLDKKEVFQWNVFLKPIKEKRQNKLSFSPS